MKLLQIQLYNFRCFEELTMDIPSKNGLYLLSGKNLQNPRSGSNGTGKSSLLDSICWALYGQTANGRKAKSLQRWNSKNKGYGVTLKFDTSVIKRTWSPISLTLDGIEVQQQVITDLIGLTLEQYRSTIYFSQRPSHFMDLTPGEKLAFLSGVFNLDEWIKCGEVSHSKSQLHEVASTSIQSKIDQTSGLIKFIEDRVEKLETQSSDWKSTQLKDLEEAIQKVEKSKSNKPKEAPVEKLTVMLQDLGIKIQASNKSWDSANTKVRELQSTKKQLAYELDRINDERFEFIKKENGVCPECKQEIKNEHFNKISHSLSERLDVAQKAVQEVSSKLLEADEVLEKEKETQKGLSKTQNDLNGLLKTAQNQQNMAMGYEIQHAHLIEKCEEIQKKVNPYIQQMEEDKLKKKDLEKTLQDLRSSMQSSLSVLERYAFWVSRFPRIRLEMLNTIATELDIYFNQAFSKLGLENWTCSVQTERELANQNVKRELNVPIKFKDQDVDYDGLSGGEQQRVRLATDVGISTLIKNRPSCRWQNMLIFDEPSKNLSQEGIEDMIDTLGMLADDNVILYADHRVLSFNKFDGVFEFSKDQSGVSVLTTF